MVIICRAVGLRNWGTGLPELAGLSINSVFCALGEQIYTNVNRQSLRIGFYFFCHNWRSLQRRGCGSSPRATKQPGDWCRLLGAEPQVLQAFVRSHLPMELSTAPAWTHGVPSCQHAPALCCLSDVFQVSNFYNHFSQFTNYSTISKLSSSVSS